jgi:hypothetical protein
VSDRTLSLAELEQRRTAPLKHGAYSANQIRSRARAHRRRFLRQGGLRASDLDAVAAAYLDGWARALGKVDLFDADQNRNGELREYFAALNSARLWLAKLEARLAATGLELARDGGRKVDALHAHLAERYGGEA